MERIGREAIDRRGIQPITVVTSRSKAHVDSEGMRGPER